MKKLIAAFFAVTVTAGILLCPARSFASEEASSVPFSWYCRHTKNGEIPVCPPEMSFIEKHDAFFIDRRADDKKKVIYLTFDAGYENGNVEKIVDVMKEKNVTGAFFVLENIIKTEPELMKKMAANGNLICNHTSKHKDMTCADFDGFENELRGLEETLKNECGLQMAHFYRPPEGRFSEKNLVWAEKLGYKTVLWSFAYVDWDNNRQPEREKAISKIIDGTHNGEIILLHPTSATNAEILGELIDRWRDMGYTFGTLDELDSKRG